MSIRPGYVVLGVVGLAAGVLGVWAMREATLSTHGPVDPSSQVELVVQARTRGSGERGLTLELMVDALLHTCRLEISSDISDPIRNEGNGRFRTVLKPSLDQTDRRQLRGCIEDWTIDHLLAEVVAFEPSP
jgi:hypothetical protein